MITIIGDDTLPEYLAARAIKAKLEHSYPQPLGNNSHKAWLVVSPQCFGSPTRDVDLLLLADYSGDPIAVQLRDRRTIHLSRIAATIEVKDHGADAVQLKGTNVHVRNQGKWKDATIQAQKQPYSVKHTLYQQCRIDSLFISDLLFFTNISSRELATSALNNILWSDSPGSDLVRRLAEGVAPHLSKACTADCPQKDFATAVEVFVRQQQATPLDRRKIELATRRYLQNQQYASSMGGQLLMFRGRGGTGKTVTLLQIAHDLRLCGHRVLLLTYNGALVTDIRRLMTLMAIDRDDGEGRVAVRTVNSFVQGLGRSPFIAFPWVPISDYTSAQYEVQYEACRTHAYQQLAALSPEDMPLIREQDRCDLNWDFVLIDEGQDWPTEERAIVKALYGPERLVIADGRDQLINATSPAKWLDDVPAPRRKVVHLRKSLRLKAGLCRFVEVFAEQCGIQDWDVQADEELGAGRVTIVSGQHLNREAWRELFDRNEAEGNKPIDMLCCVPPSGVARDGKRAVSTVGRQLRDWGHNIWDGVDRSVRGEVPGDTSALRIVSYDSCRGLEGWVVVAHCFDQFYDYKQQVLPSDSAGAQALARWLMIPLTRAIDSLVIHVSQDDHPVTQLLRAASGQCGSFVEWRSADGTSTMPTRARPSSVLKPVGSPVILDQRFRHDVWGLGKFTGARKTDRDWQIDALFDDEGIGQRTMVWSVAKKHIRAV